MQGQHPSSQDGNIDFSFLPRALLEKCKPFIIRYHELNGFSSLPDLLWHPEIRKFIEADPALRQEFKKATSTRRAREANQGFISIAVLILSVEILGIGLAGWARRYPTASKKAQALLAEYAPRSPARLSERYLLPQINRNPAMLGTLAPNKIGHAH